MPFKAFESGRERPPYYAERADLARLSEAGVADIWLTPDGAPGAFWDAMAMVLELAVVTEETWFRFPDAREWQVEFRWVFGYGESDPFQLLRADAPASVKLSGIEILLDLSQVVEDPEPRVQDASRKYRVGIRLEDNRFFPLESEEIHSRVVRPTLLLLRDTRYRAVDAAYRKGFERILANDEAGAITAALTSMEEMLKAVGAKGNQLLPLAASARSLGLVGPGVEQQISKMHAFRSGSDAHASGHADRNLAFLVMHMTGSLLLYLGEAWAINESGLPW